jgi:hypothetical protein
MSNALPAPRSPREQRQDLIAKALLGDAQSQCAMGELCRLVLCRRSHVNAVDVQLCE